MTCFDIKILAFTFMLIDHTGRLFFPDATIMVALGRLSFPLFAWFAAMGEKHTRDINKYVTRLILLGIISQPIYTYIYYLIFDTLPKQLNILFTLTAGILIIRASKLINHLIGKLLMLLSALFLASACYITQIPCLEGGAYSLTTIYLMSFFNYHQVDIIWWILYITANFCFWYFFKYPTIELISIFAPMMIIAFYNQQQGFKAKLAYAFYPLHFIVLGIMNALLK